MPSPKTVFISVSGFGAALDVTFSTRGFGDKFLFLIYSSGGVSLPALTSIYDENNHLIISVISLIPGQRCRAFFGLMFDTDVNNPTYTFGDSYAIDFSDCSSVCKRIPLAFHVTIPIIAADSSNVQVIKLT